ncbi:hypothetical protein AAFF_G00049620 [Aldrovandia affinis]|uniref:Uncharacterized protein n=1 Tax=Aldrovandia affinis TaxID=143900 RepID=A0AAD7S1B9_9TELE|nr:hypothetical protein AAFF_G00049620 [Aldrovandia affinis]
MQAVPDERGRRPPRGPATARPTARKTSQLLAMPTPPCLAVAQKCAASLPVWGAVPRAKNSPPVEARRLPRRAWGPLLHHHYEARSAPGPAQAKQQRCTLDGSQPA